MLIYLKKATVIRRPSQSTRFCCFSSEKSLELTLRARQMQAIEAPEKFGSTERLYSSFLFLVSIPTSPKTEMLNTKLFVSKKVCIDHLYYRQYAAWQDHELVLMKQYHKRTASFLFSVERILVLADRYSTSPYSDFYNSLFPSRKGVKAKVS